MGLKLNSLLNPNPHLCFSFLLKNNEWVSDSLLTLLRFNKIKKKTLISFLSPYHTPQSLLPSILPSPLRSPFSFPRILFLIIAGSPHAAKGSHYLQTLQECMKCTDSRGKLSFATLINSWVREEGSHCRSAAKKISSKASTTVNPFAAKSPS